MHVSDSLKNSVSSAKRALSMTAQTTVRPQDAIDLLKSQHREVEALFAEFDASGDKAYRSKEKIAETICHKLTVHARLEETLFYPPATAADKDLVLEATEEHGNVKAMIRKIETTKAEDESYEAKVKVLKELVQHHVKEEEKELFPRCKEVLGEDMLLDIGRKMRARMLAGERRASQRTAKKAKARAH